MAGDSTHQESGVTAGQKKADAVVVDLPPHRTWTNEWEERTIDSIPSGKLVTTTQPIATPEEIAIARAQMELIRQKKLKEDPMPKSLPVNLAGSKRSSHILERIAPTVDDLKTDAAIRHYLEKGPPPPKSQTGRVVKDAAKWVAAKFGWDLSKLGRD